MQPGSAAGRIDQHRGGDQEPGARADAGIPRGLDRKAVIGVAGELEVAQGRGYLHRIQHACEGGGPVRPTPVALDADQPPRCDLPVEAEIGRDARRDAVERLAQCAGNGRASREIIEGRADGPGRHKGGHGRVGLRRTQAGAEPEIEAAPGLCDGGRCLVDRRKKAGARRSRCVAELVGKAEIDGMGSQPHLIGDDVDKRAGSAQCAA